MLAEAACSLVEGEGDRRGALAYTDALAQYAAQRAIEGRNA